MGNGVLSIPHVLRVAVEVAGLSVLLLLLRHGMLLPSVLYLSSPNSILSIVIQATMAVVVDGLLLLLASWVKMVLLSEMHIHTLTANNNAKVMITTDNSS